MIVRKMLPLIPAPEAGPGGQQIIPGFHDHMNLPVPIAPTLPPAPVIQGPPRFTEEEIRLREDNRDASHAANTQRNYLGGFRRFAEWCQSRGEAALPADPEVVEVYLSLRANSFLALATVRCDLAAISAFHRDGGFADPCRSYLVRKCMKGIANRLGREQSQAQGLTAECLAAIRATACTPRKRGGVGERWESEAVARARGNLDIAICSVMRDALLRRNEAWALQWRDVEYNDSGGLLKITRSKTDQEGETALVYIGPEAVQDLQAIQPPNPDPNAKVFGLGDHSICRRIHAAALHAGLGDGFSGHSPRIGMAQDLDIANFHPTPIMTAGRWKTIRMVAHYTKKAEAARGAVSQFHQRTI